MTRQLPSRAARAGRTLAVAALLGTFSFVGPAQADEEIVIATGADPCFGVFYVPHEIGAFEEAGLKTKLVTGASGSRQVPFILTGDFHFAMGSGGACMTTHDKDPDKAGMFAARRGLPGLRRRRVARRHRGPRGPQGQEGRPRPRNRERSLLHHRRREGGPQHGRVRGGSRRGARDGGRHRAGRHRRVRGLGALGLPRSHGGQGHPHDADERGPLGALQLDLRQQAVGGREPREGRDPVQGHGRHRGEECRRTRTGRRASSAT